ncbi:Phosphatidylinositol 4-kinase [Hondaea fermentalgiana]|uniref:Phosphatidylinositol 4-kinase n=1 Tax=Hondaea fermentalgiana TaxID=2315210 RepID=A0A2R5GBF2_9STRA|nr:Phosphatidylinositol 4-kinase [Hondaea fermentalgiana]|eukprot:GBG27038.1 Phosphatidylinositol 4-kinase [Hondaea fermentalgiana]
MGCTSSNTYAGPHGPGPLMMFQEQVKVMQRQQTLDVRSLTMLIWKARNHPEFQRIVLELVALNANERNSFVGIEFYLPQLVHMMVHLEIDWPVNTLEQFALMVSQQSMHLALQMCWTLVGLMEDYESEDAEGNRNPGADPLLYNRCATLLEKLEVAVVYGSPQCTVFEQLFRDGKVSRAELAELEKADRKAQALLISSQVPEKLNTGMFDGRLLYKRWKARGGLHTERWIERRFVIGHRVLYCLRTSDNFLKRSIPLHDCRVVVPNDPPKSHPWYFELHEMERDRKYLLAASSQEDRDAWVQELNKAINAPPKGVEGLKPERKDGEADIDVDTLTPAQVARYGFYRSERDFVRLLTDICEELRFEDRGERKTKLRARLAKLEIPGCVYIPLCGSTEAWERIVRVIPEQSTAFSTKERCPCIMTFETTNDDPERTQDVATYLYQTLGFDSAAETLLDGDFEDSVSLSYVSGNGTDPEPGSPSENADLASSSASWESARRRALARSRFVRSARSSVTSVDMDPQELRESVTGGGSSRTGSESETGGLHRTETSQSVDMPNIWFEYDPTASESKDEPETEDKKNRKPSFAGKSALAGAAASSSPSTSAGEGTSSERPEEVHDRKSLQVESLALQAIDFFEKRSRSIAKSPGGANGNGSTMAPPLSSSKSTMHGSFMSTPRVATRPKGVYLAALGKYLLRDDASEAEGAPEKTVKPSPVHGEGPPIGKLLAKSNDDLRQEAFIMQLIKFLHDIWADQNLALWIRPYKILSTSQSTGMLEVLQNSNSFDGIKKDNNNIRIGDFFRQKFSDPDELAAVQQRYTESMAGYSLVCYILGIKDRHNGNIMLEEATGRIMHIDFGFVLGMAPGKDKVKHTNFSMERAPFKLTPELVDAMGGEKSENWARFKDLLVQGLLEARKHLDTLVTMIEITGYKSRLPCFNQPGGGVERCVRELKERLMLNLSETQLDKKVRAMADKAAHSTGTIIYERFQLWSNGIAPVLY